MGEIIKRVSLVCPTCATGHDSFYIIDINNYII